MTPATDTRPGTHCAPRCRLLAALSWPASRPSPRQLHRMLSSLADLLDAVATAHRLTTELAALARRPEQGWGPALKAIDAAAVEATDTAALTRQLIDHDLDEAAGLLRQGRQHRLQTLQLLRRAVVNALSRRGGSDPRDIRERGMARLADAEPLTGRRGFTRLPAVLLVGACVARPSSRRGPSLRRRATTAGGRPTHRCGWRATARSCGQHGA
jgi:hypothetical protein